ncbi:unnamed protein product [Orchesella dallaii]|uniref:CUB domain-containing protein n=1 Tax=Orchesella dallaii TaxID=48710 RepID=A0ABP1S8C6_9HEXA
MGSRAIVRFTSKDIRIGKGFRLRFLKRQDFDTTIEPEGSKCGGIIVGQTGYLNYKLGKDYLNNEGCVWLLHSPGSVSVHLQLIEDEFEICCDYISVNTVDPETGVIRNDTKLFNARNWNQTIEAPLLVILFQSDYSKPGKGFSLQYRSNGNQLNVKYKYKLQHIIGMFGSTEYPSEQAKWEVSGRGEQDIFMIASSKIKIPDKYYTVIDWKFQPPNGSCLQHHSFAIYEPLSLSENETSVPGIWVKREQFPKSNKPDCSSVNSMPTKYNEKFKQTFNVATPVFIILYKSLFDGNNGTETRFKFDYSQKRNPSQICKLFISHLLYVFMYFAADYVYRHNAFIV